MSGGSGETFLGQADAGTGSSLFNTLDFHIRQVLNELSIATLVKIVKAPYDKQGNPIPPGTVGPVGYVDVQPLVNQLDGNGNPIPHGTVFRLSYHRYQSASGAFISDPAVGDIGKMVVADRDTSVVRSTDAAANPGSQRKFDKADGTFFGQTQAGTPSQFFTWTASGFSIGDKNGNTIVGGPTGVTINGVLIPKAGITFNLKTHKHTQGVDSHGDAEVPTDAPVNGS